MRDAILLDIQKNGKTLSEIVSPEVSPREIKVPTQAKDQRQGTAQSI